MTASGVRRGKAVLFQWVQVPPCHRSSRKQPEQSWRWPYLNFSDYHTLAFSGRLRQPLALAAPESSRPGK